MFALHVHVQGASCVLWWFSSFAFTETGVPAKGKKQRVYEDIKAHVVVRSTGRHMAFCLAIKPLGGISCGMDHTSNACRAVGSRPILDMHN